MSPPPDSHIWDFIIRDIETAVHAGDVKEMIRYIEGLNKVNSSFSSHIVNFLKEQQAEERRLGTELEEVNELYLDTLRKAAK
ncbi:hypothetical protein M5689_003325 [Euphorbia peplus]|nr:hypothetical protein M5689_003325 [Euphorbia peplus]